MEPVYQRKPASEATDTELRDYLRVHNIPVEPQSSRDILLERLKTAHLPDPIFVVTTLPAIPVSQESHDIDELFAEPFTKDDERWLRIKIQPEGPPHGPGTAEVGFRTDHVQLPRGQDIVLRERFVRALNDARIGTRVLDPERPFSESTRLVEHQFPFQLIAVVGRVADGYPEDLPHGCRLVRR